MPCLRFIQIMYKIVASIFYGTFNRKISDMSGMNGSSKKYHMTMKGVMKWAAHEIKSVGWIVGVEDPDIQYAYAQSTVNGMLHLRDALFEMINDPSYSEHKEELTRTHDKVVRVIKHLIKDFDVKLEEIKTFNTRQVLGDLSYLNEKPALPVYNNANSSMAGIGGRRRSRKSRKSRTRRNSRKS